MGASKDTNQNTVGSDSMNWRECGFYSNRDANLQRIKDGGYYEESSGDLYDVSVLICTYHPNIPRLLYAIHSALLQRDVKCQIVITDDGSENFDIETIIEYFYKNNCHDFTICRLKQNAGTVNNFQNGLRYCKGEFIRGLSPEDYLYGYDTLREWIDYSKKCQVSLSFSDVICYQFDNNTIKPIRSLAHPQITRKYYNNMWEYNYLVFQDLCVGTGMLVKREIMTRYFNYIAGKVIYVEDNVYRIMAYRHERMAFYPRPTVLYEVGNGISTSNSDVWYERIRKDRDETDKIILEQDQLDKKLYDCFNRLCTLRKEKNVLRRKIGKLLLPGYFCFYLKCRIHPRYTTTSIDDSYVRELLEL